MNIGFIFDIDDVVTEADLNIPYLSALYYRHFSADDFVSQNIIDFRGSVLQLNYVGKEIHKHIYYIVVNNKKESIAAVAKCLDDIQKSRFEFSQDKDEVHVVLNMVVKDGVSLTDYERMMPCLKNNAVCIYNWLLEKYDYGGGMPISEPRRAHAIARLASLISNHRRDISLIQMDVEGRPIYNLFGNSSVFFNDEERDRAARNYYYFKSLQHLLNYSDKSIDDYLAENVVPFKDDKDEMKKRVDSTYSAFLRDNYVPIEASFITEKTQCLLLKSSNDDADYLINATDNGLVFIDDLSRKQQWQMKDTDNVLRNYWDRVSNVQELQSIVSDNFLSDIQERVIIHKRTVFDEVNNEVSSSRRNQVESFKDKIDNYLLDFFNRKEGQYTALSEVLVPSDVLAHRSNIDCGIAFLSYMESGDAECLSDHKVSAGDVNLSKIRESLRIEEVKRLHELQEKEIEIKTNYAPGADGKPSYIKNKFDTVDRNISGCNESIRLLNIQLEKWYDGDAEGKLTARTRSMIAILSGVLFSAAWVAVYFKWLRTDTVDKYPWVIFSLLLFIGVLVGVAILWNVVRQRNDREKQMHGLRERKKKMMSECMSEMTDLVERRYRHMLAYHGLKTMNELVDYVRTKKEDLKSFHKMLFRLLLNYKLAVIDESARFDADSNTIELRDIDVTTLLFGPEGEKKRVAFCLNSSAGSSLSAAFEDYKSRKVRFETSRFSPDYKQHAKFDPEAIESEVIPCMEVHADKGYEYTALNRVSILPEQEGVEMDDVRQGEVGDCYFMATLAAIAQMNPDYIIGKRGMIEPLRDDNRFFRVKFYDRDGNRVNVDIDNKFWNEGGCPIYAREGKLRVESSDTYDPWVMAVEKAWAKLNKNGYDGIEGASSDGREKVRMVEYSYAVTGKSAFYCMTKNVPDKQKLLEMMKKHVLTNKLPITLYSASSSDSSFANKDPYLVHGHAYALRAVHEDGTFDIFNPWNNHMADEDEAGKHYENVDIDFIKDNFDVVVFFDIKESDFSSFERDLTGNASEIELVCKIEGLMNAGLCQLDPTFNQLNDLMDDDVLGKLYQHSVYLFNKARIKDSRGVDKKEQNLIYMEPISVDANANKKLRAFLIEKGETDINMLNDRDDLKQSLTILRVSPPFMLANFYDAE